MNDVKRNPDLADVPDNVIPSREGNAGHVKKYHPSGTRAGSSGEMIDRSGLEKEHMNGNYVNSSGTIVNQVESTENINEDEQ